MVNICLRKLYKFVFDGVKRDFKLKKIGAFMTGTPPPPCFLQHRGT